MSKSIVLVPVFRGKDRLKSILLKISRKSKFLKKNPGFRSTNSFSPSLMFSRIVPSLIMISLTMANVCRACLLQKDFEELCDWWLPMDGIDEPLTFLECFQLCTQLDVKNTSSESNIINMHYLCKDCIHELTNAFRFIRKAQQSDQVLSTTSIKDGIMYENKYERINMQENDDSKGYDPDQLTSYEEHLALDTNEEEPYELRNLLVSTENQRSASTFKKDVVSDIIHSEETYLCQTENNKCLGKSQKHDHTMEDAESGRMSPEKCGESYNIICEFCSKTVKENQYKRHVSRFHSKNGKLLLCYTCPATFEDVFRLKRHEETHQTNRQRLINCNDCQRRFFTQNAYRTHMKTHEKNREPKFKCDQCDKTFFYNGSLKLHKQSHTGLSYKCTICSKKYPRSVDLRIHVRSHSGELPYKCPKCNQCFKYVHVLNKHVRHHEGHRYKCNLCGKEYAHQSTMLQHRKEHTGLPLRCSICDKGFVKKSKMRRHIGGVHKVTDVEEIDQLIVKVKTKTIYRGRITEM